MHAAGPPRPDMKARREPRVPRGSGRVSGQQWQAGGGMSRGAVVAAEMTDGTGSARARQRFLAEQPLEPGQVRDTIMASWQRSRHSNVAAGRIDPCYVADRGLGTPLPRSALAVLQSLLGEGLEDWPVSVILTDAGGVVLRRLTADHDLERHLDS